MRAFVPIRTEPFQSFVDGGHGFLGVALHIGVFDPQHKFPAVMPREEPVEKGSARSADVQVASRRGSKANADVRHWSNGVMHLFPGFASHHQSTPILHYSKKIFPARRRAYRFFGRFTFATGAS